MSYLNLFTQVSQFVEAKGLVVETELGGVVTESKLRKAEKRLGHALPESLLEMYREVGNGFRLWWELDPTDENGDSPMGGFEIPTLKDFVSQNVSERASGIEWEEDYEYPLVEDRGLALQTAAKMRKWLKFHDEGNGDCFCLDMGQPEGPIVYNRFTWFSEGSGDNGAQMAANLKEFFTNWARVCFQCPASLWWESIVQDGKIDWTSSEFHSEFRLSRLDG